MLQNARKNLLRGEKFPFTFTPRVVEEESQYTLCIILVLFFIGFSCACNLLTEETPDDNGPSREGKCVRNSCGKTTANSPVNKHTDDIIVKEIVRGLEGLLRKNQHDDIKRNHTIGHILKFRGGSIEECVSEVQSLFKCCLKSGSNPAGIDDAEPLASKDSGRDVTKHGEKIGALNTQKESSPEGNLLPKSDKGLDESFDYITGSIEDDTEEMEEAYLEENRLLDQQIREVELHIEENVDEIYSRRRKRRARDDANAARDEEMRALKKTLVDLFDEKMSSVNEANKTIQNMVQENNKEIKNMVQENNKEIKNMVQENKEIQNMVQENKEIKNMVQENKEIKNMVQECLDKNQQHQTIEKVTIQGIDREEFADAFDSRFEDTENIVEESVNRVLKAFEKDMKKMASTEHERKKEKEEELWYRKNEIPTLIAYNIEQSMKTQSQSIIDSVSERVSQKMSSSDASSSGRQGANKQNKCGETEEERIGSNDSRSIHNKLDILAQNVVPIKGYLEEQGVLGSALSADTQQKKNRPLVEELTRLEQQILNLKKENEALKAKGKEVQEDNEDLKQILEDMHTSRDRLTAEFDYLRKKGEEESKETVKRWKKEKGEIESKTKSLQLELTKKEDYEKLSLTSKFVKSISRFL